VKSTVTHATRDAHLVVSDHFDRQFRDWGFYDPKQIGSPRILIASGHGYGNIGDEAQLGACIARWREVSPDSHISVFSPHPPFTEALHDVECLWAPRVAWFRSNTTGPYDGHSRAFEQHYRWLRWRLRLSARLLRKGWPLAVCGPRESSILLALQQHDVLHISGGGFLTGKTRSRLWENSLLMQVARIMRIPFMLTGHTIGVFQNEADRRVARDGLRAARYISLRDRGISQAELAQIGISGPHVESTCDDALFCPPLPPEQTKQALTALGVDVTRPWVAVNFHDWGQDDSIKGTAAARFAAVCDQLVDRHSLQVVFIAMAPLDIGPERMALERMKRPAWMLPYTPDYRLVRGVIAQSLFVVSFKHHPIVFAQGEEVPSVAIALDDYYRHKNQGALENTGHGGYLIDHAAFFGDQIFEKIDLLLNKRGAIVDAIQNWTNAMRRVQLEPYQRILSSIGCLPMG
jgi:polysaccharide pyruvyl transferase WcaK-like protein